MRKKLVSLENIQYKYEGQTDFALNDVSFDIYESEWLAIVGHNGSGKSTLAKLIKWPSVCKGWYDYCEW